MTAIEHSPLVSIIIPCWNAEDYVGEAIESALAQTYPNVEVIVIDDGSTDDSLAVIKSFDRWIRWITRPRLGGGAARNKGLELSNGSLIQFLDSDDILFPNKLARMVPLASIQKMGVTPICNWSVEHVDYDLGIELITLTKEADEDPVVFCLRSRLQTASPLHSKMNLLAIGGFDVSLTCCQERDLHLRLVCNGVDFVHLPEILYRMRKRRGSVSSDYKRVQQARGPIFERAFNTLSCSGKLNATRRDAFAKALARDARLCLRNGERELARQYFLKAKSISQEGLLQAFGWVGTRTIARLLGPIWAERSCRAGLWLGFRR